MKKLGIDTGGTFTDFVYSDGDVLRIHKVLSTPDAPERAILQGIREMGLALDDLLVIHGSTVATNAVLEGKGVRTAYITNRGFADVLTIGRQARRELYNLRPEPREPPVPRESCLETGGRLAADGALLEPLTGEDIAALQRAIERLRPDAVAINLLFSFLDDRYEKQIAEAMPEGIFVSRSSAVLNEYREYERGMATWLNAWVGPIMQHYLARLAEALRPAVVTVMQSHGGTIAAQQAGEHAVELLLSGPAGGLTGARYQGHASGADSLMSFDMGGTSTDVALIEGDIRLTREAEIAGYPVAVPMVDMHTIGAGGGSIAWLDDGGLLQVGPRSAGAVPGPACYGQGGREATVTDANLLLGRLPLSVSPGGSLSLDLAASRKAIGELAARIGLAPEATAEGIIRIANEHMVQALRVISVQRGFDPRAFSLLSFGGAGGLHVCALAEQLGMTRAIVPRHGGVLSALGMLVAPRARQRSHTRIEPLEGADMAELRAGFSRMEQWLRRDLSAEGVSALNIDYSVDLRYAGQSSTLNLDWDNDSARLAQAFHAAHREQFGHDLEIPVELVNLRARAAAVEAPVTLPVRLPDVPAEPVAHTAVFGLEQAVPVYDREQLAAGQAVAGPAILVESVATTWLSPDWRAMCDLAGNLLLERLSGE